MTKPFFAPPYMQKNFEGRNRITTAPGEHPYSALFLPQIFSPLKKNLNSSRRLYLNSQGLTKELIPVLLTINE